LWNLNGAAGFIGYFAKSGRRRRNLGGRLSVRRCACAQGHRGGGDRSPETGVPDDVHDSSRAKNSSSLGNKKAPRDNLGQWTSLFLAKSAASAAREGGLAYGFLADHSGGTAADSHGLPRFPCLQNEIRVYAAPAGVSMRG
jgi:hypothetical protein